MNNSDAIDLASMLCSRLCHDMLSPVGALSNGLELLAEEKDPEMRQRCFELLEQSARISADKLKFFRLAYGAAGGFGDAVDVSEAKAVVDALAGDAKRVEVNWALSESHLPKPAVKVLLNFAHIGIDSLVRGGTLDIGAEIRDGASEIVVRAAGAKVAFDESIGAALEGNLPRENLSSRTAAAHLLYLLADHAGGGLQYKLTGDALVLGAVLPNG
ncbi:histidine phosphotransferase family protein [Pelagerythrobacter marinus]|jgi:histidine phosphotransferase ChpT|uniref:histidine phosphotransferase family protein n=1 Tax=Pelagerythrobacter marinus TaxID=538382 RepID=UPI002036D09E|nr:histidine phosphotransferase family protein [Pelagerythrobacter marinus]MEC9066791.1 histidine phosphotransferase family protein [Pseudomonadota bacterium]USA39910.1 histidine phosphotransferase family protein [Pelagerythrobacter marinus]WPZ05971.1 histidine phosphotransferase family protein [Pelagerythrobacter marinus]